MDKMEHMRKRSMFFKARIKVTTILIGRINLGSYCDWSLFLPWLRMLQNPAL